MFSLSIWVSVASSILFLRTAGAQQQLSGSADADRQLLLQFKNSIDNWATFQIASGIVDWNDTTPMCEWGGLQCSPAGRVTALYLGCEHCSVKASGTLLPSLALLDQLQELHLDRNWFNGTLPPAFAFGFPALVKLRLDYNSLTGVIPLDWGQPGAFPSLETLHIGGNQLKGVLPHMGMGALSKVQDRNSASPCSVALRGDCADVKAYRAGTYSDGALDDACIARACQNTWVPMQSIGLQWNMLHGSVPASWANLRANSVWLRPGNYQLCGTKPENASFEICKEVDDTCEAISSLGEVCSLEVPATPRMMPPPTANPTMLEAVMRLEGANIIPFTANNLNILVTAVVSQLPNVTAKDIVISQVVPVVSLNGSGNPANGRQTLATPAAWPVPPNWALPSMLPPHHDNDAQLSGYSVDNTLGNPQSSVGNGPYSQAVTIVGGRRRLLGGNRRLLTGERITDAAVPAMAPVQKTAVKPALVEPNAPGSEGAAIIIGGDTGAQHPTQASPSWGEPFYPPVLSMPPVWSPASAAAAPGLLSPQLVPGMNPADAAAAPMVPRPYGTPVPGGILIGADISMQIRTIANGNVSEAEDMVSSMCTSSTFVTRLQQGGLGVVKVLLVSCEPLDPEELPVRLRPPPYNVTFPLQGIPTSSAAAAPAHFPNGIIIGIVLAAAGLLLAVVGVSTLLIWNRKKRLHPSGSPGSSLTETQSTDVLKQGDGLDRRTSSAAAYSSGTHSQPDRRDSLRTLHSDMETSAGQLLGQRSSDLGAMSDATLIARLGNEHTAGPALQQIAERQAMGMHASSSGQGQHHAANGWAGPDKSYSLGKEGSSIELPSMPWSDWEVSGDQIEICKRPDGSDWELGAGAFGKVFKALRGGVQVVAVKILHDAEVGSVNFVREIAILKGCRHTNIVQFQGACISGDKTMLVMEFVEGGDLWRNLQRPGSRVGKWHLQGRKVALDIARGLCFLHAHSIVLFDLKSHNVLLTRDGTGKIADVGLAKVLTQGYVSKLDEVAGTFAWAAPELLMGGRCSEKVDIYSFGVVLWELATCERPQRGAMRDVRVPEEVPEEVAQLMNECLAYDPKQRPSAKEIYDRLSAAQNVGSEGSSGPQAPKSQQQQPSCSSGSPAPQSAAQPQSLAMDPGSAPALQQQDEATYRELCRGMGATEVSRKSPTPLGITRLPIKSAFDMSD